MYYCIPTSGKCKCCGRKFGYVTVQHKVLVIAEENKDLATEHFGILDSTLAEVDFKLLERLNIPWIELKEALQQCRVSKGSGKLGK